MSLLEELYPTLDPIPPGRDMYADHPIAGQPDYGDDCGNAQLAAIAQRLRDVVEGNVPDYSSMMDELEDS